jgi:hypothetical protein
MMRIVRVGLASYLFNYDLLFFQCEGEENI